MQVGSITQEKQSLKLEEFRLFFNNAFDMADFDVAMDDGEAEEESDSEDSVPAAAKKKKKTSRKKKTSPPPAAASPSSPNLGTRRGGRQRTKKSYAVPGSDDEDHVYEDSDSE